MSRADDKTTYTGGSSSQGYEEGGNKRRPRPEDDDDSENEIKKIMGADYHKTKATVRQSLDIGMREETPKTYKCSFCNLMFYKSDTMPLRPQWRNWQGHLFLACFDCCQCRHSDHMWNMKDYVPTVEPEIGSLERKRTDKQTALLVSQRIADTVPLPPDGFEPHRCDWILVDSKDGTNEQRAAKRMNVQIPVADTARGYRRQPMVAKGSDKADFVEWKKAAKAGWTSVQIIRAADFVYRTRNMTYTNLLESAKRDHPGLSGRAIRKHLLATASYWVSAIAKFYEKATEDQRVAVETALNDYTDERCEAALSADERKEIAEGVLPLHDAAQFLSTIVEGLDQEYVCRDPECHSITPPNSWLQSIGIYRCPWCSLRYQPWAIGNAPSHSPLVPAQKCFIMDTTGEASIPFSDDGVEGPWHTSGVAVNQTMLAGTLVAANKTYSMFLCEWEDKPMQDLVDKFKLIQAGLISEMLTATPNELKMKVLDLCTTANQKAYFQLRTVPQATIDLRDTLNQAPKWSTRPWSFGNHMRQPDGSYTALRTDYQYVEGKTKVLTAEDQMRFWAFSKYQIDCAMKCKGRESAQ